MSTRHTHRQGLEIWFPGQTGPFKGKWAKISITHSLIESVIKQVGPSATPDVFTDAMLRCMIDQVCDAEWVDNPPSDVRSGWKP